MNSCDYGMEAVLFFAKGMNFRQQVLEYRVFGRAAEAIRFVIEDLPSNVLRGCSLEVGEDRYSGDAILRLYESVDFPLPRRAKPPK
ncbi:MAG TPA: hypothetical protein VME69_09135 [Methylocella sp.]|nr:hypothetical protein [Methylocella sp.]